MDDQLARILDRLDGVRPSGAGYDARCPAHDDRVASLSVSTGDSGGVVVHCHAGCDTDKVIAAAGLTMTDLAGAPHVVAEYAYTTEAGDLLYTVERWQPKTFKVRPGLPPPAQRVLYAAPWVRHARETGTPIHVVEGERDVNRLLGMGIAATCNVGGAGKGKWLPQYTAALAGCLVVVIADDDATGHVHARAIAKALTGHARHVSLCVPPVGNDVSDLLDAGYPLTSLLPLPEEGDLPMLGADTVRAQKLDWAWPRYIPFGMLSTVEGDPGDGKSTLTIDLVARWSSGLMLPGDGAHGGPYMTLMISAEDDLERVIVPRLRAAGADLANVRLLASGADPTRPFDLGADLDALERSILAKKIRVVILDPLAAFLPDDADAHSDHKVRRALYPLHLLARRTETAIIAVRHLSKSATKAIYAGNGSIGIVAAARAAFLVRPHPSDPNARVFAAVKANLGALPPALGYRIVSDEINDCARIAWEGVVDLTAQDAMDGPAAAEERSRVDDAADYLTELVTAPMTWKEIAARGKIDGYSEITLRRARSAAVRKISAPRVVPWSDDDHLTGIYWVIPDAVAQFTTGTTRDSTTDSDQSTASTEPSAQMLSDSPPTKSRANEQERKPPPPTDHSESPVDPEAELLAKPRVCDQCGNVECLVYAAPWWCIRCRAHDPRVWSPDGKPSVDPKLGPTPALTVPKPSPGDIGPCAKCRAPHHRYGPGGQPLCQECRDAKS
jgi:putative DNA primase/helicase